MKDHRTHLKQVLIALIVLTSLAPLNAAGQTPAQLLAAERINRSIGNGIRVEIVKVYDDTSLQLMLNSARAQLAALQAFDQTGLTSRIGAVTGATLQQQSLGIQVAGPSIPGVTTNNLGGTGSTSSTTNANGTSTTTNAGQPVENVTTTIGQQNPLVPSAPVSSVGLPTSGFSISPADALNQMMQLSYEIANLRMLLEGSLTDRYVLGQRLIKPRTTLGFPVTITSQPQYKDAVAVVEVETISPASGTFSSEAPTVTALLPREKTYNVASLTDKMTSVGGGVVTQLLNGGFSLLRGHKSYYIVQDQDTLASMQAGPNDQTTVFSWQFRPVLGQRFVKSGLRQTFVQVAVPIVANTGCYGGVRVRTYWRKYDRKNGVLNEVIAESIREEASFRPIPVYDTRPVIAKMSYEDLGSGQVLVSVHGNFQTGTYIRVGPTLYRDGSSGFTSELTQLRFVAAATDLAKYKAKLVSRDGTEIDIVDPQEPLPALDTRCSLVPVAGINNIPDVEAKAVVGLDGKAVVTALDNSNSVVTVTLSSRPAETDVHLENYLLVIGGKVYGLSDAPIERVERDDMGRSVLRVVVPNSLLRSAADVEVRTLLAPVGKKFLLSNNAEGVGEKIVSLGKIGGGKTKFLLYGTRLKTATILQPGALAFTATNSYGSPDTLREFEVPDPQIKETKQIVIQKAPGERPIFVQMPDAGGSKPTITVAGRVTLGTNELPVLGDSWDKLVKVTFNGATVITRVSPDDKKTLVLLDLAKLGVTGIAREVQLDFEFAEGVKASLKLDIVSSKVEFVKRDP